MVTVLIPLGGSGQRFKAQGYKQPKPFVKVLGKEILFWLIDNLSLPTSAALVIPYHNALGQAAFELRVKQRYPSLNFVFVPLRAETRGAAETAFLAAKHCIAHKLVDPNDPVISLDGDNCYIDYDILKAFADTPMGHESGAVFAVQDDSDATCFSFVVENDGKVEAIAEKRRISNLACTGAYAFGSLSTMLALGQRVAEDDRRPGEPYMSHMIQALIDGGNAVHCHAVPRSSFVCLGTPLQARMFNNARAHAHLAVPTRFCFDLDNTLVTSPAIKGDYASVLPMHANVLMVRHLKQLGHTVIVHTARRMRTHGGDVGKVVADVGKVTIDTLERFGIPYDELYFGKPHADVYIDDLAVNAHENLEKELGFYVNNTAPRSFNRIEYGEDTVSKFGDNLGGEIHWYQNVPASIADLFPRFIRHDTDGHHYVIERLDGASMSKIYCAGEMTVRMLDDVMECIDRIHEAPTPHGADRSQRIDTYSDKLTARYDPAFYARFRGSIGTRDALLEFCSRYDGQQESVPVVVHGDPVMSNIILTKDGRLKFIDMRGLQAGVPTLLGDRFYDWAKLYQSLLGYNSIIEDTPVGRAYELGLVLHFETRFRAKYGQDRLRDLGQIVALLLFTLLPLHRDDPAHCAQFHELAQEILDGGRLGF